MHTTQDTASSVRRRPPRRLPLYYRGLKAEVWITAFQRRAVHGGAEGRTR
jgi:hypothetical protein